MYDLIVVDDDITILDCLRISIKTYKTWHVKYFATCEEAYDCWSNIGAKTILTDINFSNMNGYELISLIKADSPVTPIYVMTGGHINNFIKSNALYSFTKPFYLKEVLELLSESINEVSFRMNVNNCKSEIVKNIS